MVGRTTNLAGRRPSLAGVLATGEDHGGPGPNGQIIGTGSSPRVHSDLVAYGQGQGQRVRSFQQLHMAAKVLNPFLKKKVKDWAETSGGKFPLKAQYHDSVGTSSMYVRWDVAMAKENMLLKEKIAWAAVKDPVRAMKKAILCYNGDVSRLTDLCRQSIIFEHFIDLFTCLEDIASDPEVEVVRVVNRFDPSYSGDDTLGYRHIKINLRVTTKETRRLHLDSHICEVQLAVAELRQLVTDEEHARFLDFRKLKETRILQMFISLFAKSPSEVSTVEVSIVLDFCSWGCFPKGLGICGLDVFERCGVYSRGFALSRCCSRVFAASHSSVNIRATRASANSADTTPRAGQRDISIPPQQCFSLSEIVDQDDSTTPQPPLVCREFEGYIKAEQRGSAVWSESSSRHFACDRSDAAMEDGDGSEREFDGSRVVCTDQLRAVSRRVV